MRYTSISIDDAIAAITLGYTYTHHHIIVVILGNSNGSDLNMRTLRIYPRESRHTAGFRAFAPDTHDTHACVVSPAPPTTHAHTRQHHTKFNFW